jgi:hypothetical protein
MSGPAVISLSDPLQALGMRSLVIVISFAEVS